MRFQFDEEMALAESQRPFLFTLCSFKTNCLFCLFPSSFFALLRGVSLLPELCYVCVAHTCVLGARPLTDAGHGMTRCERSQSDKIKKPGATKKGEVFLGA